MQFFCGDNSSLHRFTFRLKSSQIVRFAVFPNLSGPIIAVISFIHAFILAVHFSKPLVLALFFSCGFSQITNRMILRVAINMIYFRFWIFTIKNHPRSFPARIPSKFFIVIQITRLMPIFCRYYPNFIALLNAFTVARPVKNAIATNNPRLLDVRDLIRRHESSFHGLEHHPASAGRDGDNHRSSDRGR